MIRSKSEATTARYPREFIECAFFGLKFSIVRWRSASKLQTYVTYLNAENKGHKSGEYLGDIIKETVE